MNVKKLYESLDENEKEELTRIVMSNNPHFKITTEYYRKHTQMSQRLKHALMRIEDKFKYIEQISLNDLRKVYLCGDTTVKEFKELRGL